MTEAKALEGAARGSPEASEKKKWGPGPWLDEPDRVEFSHAGLPCLMVRQPRSGHWCGYAAVPPGHPMHGKSYDDTYGEPFNIDIHGSLTYADKCGGNICHVPRPGEPDDVWWFGFDCHHSGDLSPRDAMSGYGWAGDTYKDAIYVRAETQRLAEQLASAASARNAPPETSGALSTEGKEK